MTDAATRISVQGYGVYIRATTEALAASPEVQALIREAEARGVERAGGLFTKKLWVWNAHEIQEKVRAEAAAIRGEKT